MMTQDVERLSVVIGRGVRAVRDEHGLTADDVAAAARKVGLSWGRSTLASIETGRRGLTAEELVLLPIVLRTARPGLEVTLLELIRERVSLSAKASAGPAGIAQVLRGEPLTIGKRTWQLQPFAEALKGFAQQMSDLARLLPDPEGPAEEGLQALEDARHEAVAKAAKRLGRPPVQVAHAARQRWGRSFQEERDRRMAARVELAAPAATVKAVRGHVTRELLADLAEDLAAYPTPKEA